MLKTNHLARVLCFTAVLLLVNCTSTDKAPSNDKSKRANVTANTENAAVATQAAPTAESAASTTILAPQIEDDLWARLRSGFGLPNISNQRVSHYEKRFSRNPKEFYAMLERAKWFLPTILNEVEKRQFPSELALLPAVESSFITTAKSSSNASGLWQFIPSTGRLYQLRQDKWYDGRRDPIKSTEAALQFLGELHQRFDEDWFLALAGYNAGGLTIERAIEKNTRDRKPTHFDALSLRRETRDYVPKLIAFRNIFLKPSAFGLKLPKLGNATQFAKLDAGVQIDLNLFSKLSQINPATLRFLNSAYKRNITPPNGPHILYIPMSQLGQAQAKLATLSSNDRMRWASYRVRQGDVLGRIAKRHGVSLSAIKLSNHLSSNLIHPGDMLAIPISARRRIAKPASTKTKIEQGKRTHRVQAGDTLWDIARQYGVNVALISQWNQIDRHEALQLGQILTIYTRS